MKKMYIISLILLISFSLGACQKDPTESETTSFIENNTIDTEPLKNELEIVSYAENVEFDVSYNDTWKNYTDIWIDVEFLKIVYSPLRETICVTFEVYDRGYRNAVYFGVLKNKDTDEEIAISQFSGSGSGFFSSVCFDIPETVGNYIIAIAKADTDFPSLDFNNIDYSACVGWNDENASKRSSVLTTSKTDLTEEVTESLTESNVAYSFNILDEDRILTEVIIVLRDTFGNIVETKTLSCDALREGSNPDNLQYEGEVLGLAPNVDYELELFVNGSDGVDDFSSEYLSKINLKSADFESLSSFNGMKSFHGLYAVIYQMDFTETEAIIHYVYVNEHLIKYSDDDDDDDYVELYLSFINPKTNVAINYPLQTGENIITIPIEEIDEGNYFHILDRELGTPYGTNYIQSNKPHCTILYYPENEFEIKLEGVLENIIDFKTEIFVENYAAVIETFELERVSSSNMFTIYHNTEHLDIDIVVTITYESYGKEYSCVFYF